MLFKELVLVQLLSTLKMVAGKPIIQIWMEVLPVKMALLPEMLPLMATQLVSVLPKIFSLLVAQMIIM